MFYEHIVMYTVVLPLFAKQTQQTKNLMEFIGIYNNMQTQCLLFVLC